MTSRNDSKRSERELLRDEIDHISDPFSKTLFKNGAFFIVTTGKIVFLGKAGEDPFILDIRNVDRCIQSDDPPTRVLTNAKDGLWDVYFDTEDRAARFEWVVDYAINIRRYDSRFSRGNTLYLGD